MESIQVLALTVMMQIVKIVMEILINVSHVVQDII